MKAVADVPLGYYSLALCILTNHTPEQAFHYFITGQKALTKTLTDQDYEDMIKFKETMTWREIGEIYGANEWTLYKAVARYQQRKQKEASYGKAI